MVWKAIGLCTIGELDRVKSENMAYAESLKSISELAAKLGLEVQAEKSRADRSESRYDALVEKIAAKAAKPDDGIIHAKNSGDVRRLFEQQVAAQAYALDKEN
jgi:hypothetical protein